MVGHFSKGRLILQRLLALQCPFPSHETTNFPPTPFSRRPSAPHVRMIILHHYTLTVIRILVTIPDVYLAKPLPKALGAESLPPHLHCPPFPLNSRPSLNVQLGPFTPSASVEGPSVAPQHLQPLSVHVLSSRFSGSPGGRGQPAGTTSATTDFALCRKSQMLNPFLPCSSAPFFLAQFHNSFPLNNFRVLPEKHRGAWGTRS